MVLSLIMAAVFFSQAVRKHEGVIVQEITEGACAWFFFGNTTSGFTTTCLRYRGVSVGAEANSRPLNQK